MTTSEGWAKLRTESLESLRVLVSLLESEASQSRLIGGYLESKGLLAEAFQALLRERIAPRVHMLEAVKKAITERMRARYTGAVPDRYLRVVGYVNPHCELFAYLTLFVGEPVPAAVLRILTADAVHTERRARELRDLGLDLDATTTGGTDVYILRSDAPDLEQASLKVTALNVKNDKGLDSEMRVRYLSLIGWNGS